MSHVPCPSVGRRGGTEVPNTYKQGEAVVAFTTFPTVTPSGFFAITTHGWSLETRRERVTGGTLTAGLFSSDSLTWGLTGKFHLRLCRAEAFVPDGTRRSRGRDRREDGVGWQCARLE
ncbi:hypothetical protein FRC12_018009 [Ceratobasidium sp. 428]|nr:hypothetical protein FRC12_018009 [Ceratobasidium sp. 428]